MKFETGTYKTNFISTQNLWFTVEVVKSTVKSVTFLHPHTQKETRAKKSIATMAKTFFTPWAGTAWLHKCTNQTGPPRKRSRGDTR